MTSDEELSAAVAGTSALLSAEMTGLLRLVACDPYVRGPEGLALVVQGASSAARDALREGARERAMPPLRRLTAAAWLLLIMLEMAGEDAPQPACAPTRI